MPDRVKESCYPCGAFGHDCVTDEQYQPPPHVAVDPDSVVPCPPGYKRFDVALWHRWPVPLSFPDEVLLIDAPHAFSAIEFLMQYHKRYSVAYACARAVDGSLVYRCYWPRVILPEEEEP